MAKTIYIPKKQNTSDREHDSILEAKRVVNAIQRNTSFGELVTAIRTSRFNIKPTWGISKLRDRTIVTGSGTVDDLGGEFFVSTGNTTGSTAELRTQERGQYQSGTEGEFGLGGRVPTTLLPLQNNEEIRVQYSDNDNGFGYGIDSTDFFIFRLKNGVFEKVYRTDWNTDKVDGSGNPLSNPSGLDIEAEIGNIYQVNFVWYGYGSIEFFVNVKDSAKNKDTRVVVHTLQVDNELSIIDPNQPISIYAQNDDTNARDVQVYVGGRQFSIVDGNSSVQTRDTKIYRDGTSPALNTISANQGVFVPYLVVRKKQNFNGRKNSVNCFTGSISITTNEKIYWYLSVGDTTTGLQYKSIPRVPDSETALEFAEPVLDGTETGVTQYRSIAGDVVSTGNTRSSSIRTDSRQNMGDDLEVVLWIARGSSQNASPDVYMTFQEEW